MQFNTSHAQSKCWTSNLSGYSLLSWCTYTRDETWVHQQAPLYQLHYLHPSQQLQKIFSHLHDITLDYVYIRSLGRA